MLLATSCTDDVAPESEGSLGQITPQSAEQGAARLSVGKASAIANLFSSYRGVSENTNDGSNKSAEVSPTVTSVSYYVENGDTLLFAFNYGDNNGYTIIGSNASSFPVLAQSENGKVDFDAVDASGSFGYFVSLMAESVRQSSSEPDTAYASLWNGVDSDEWEYSVEVVDPDREADTISGNKSRSRVSSGKATIYPYTGLALKDWCQAGDYNSSAKNGACIGCPAMAVGMLFYDMNNRMDGLNVKTSPSFSYSEQYPAYAKSVSGKLRKIADKWPYYKWGESDGEPSGLRVQDMEDAIRLAGFPNAKFEPFNFEKAYENMCIPGTDYFGNKTVFHRGILLTGFQNGGHIWFCDGYYEQQYQVTRRKKRLFHSTKVTRWMEYENRLFMNWGQQSTPDGWYIVENNNGLNSPDRKSVV